MGCDIHGWIERKVGKRWVAVNPLSDTGRQRNYARFAALASVRGSGPKPRGLPPDISETTKYHADSWGLDGHSHSWLPLDRAVEIFKETAFKPDTMELEFPYYEYFEIESENLKPEEYRLVFWFDN